MISLERLIMTLEQEGIEIPNEGYIDLYIGSRGDKAKMEAFVLAKNLEN